MKRIRTTDRIVLLILIVVFAVIITANTRLILKSMVNQTEQVGQTQISSIKTDFENYITNAENALIKVSGGAEQLLGEDQRTELGVYIVNQKESQLEASNGVNFNVYIAGQGWEIIPGFSAPADYHATERNWYIGAVENKGDIFITDPYIDSMTGEMCYTMSILLSDGKTVVAMDFNLSEIQQSVEKMTLNDGSTAMIVTSEGLIVGYTDMSFVGKELKKTLPMYQDLFEDILVRSGEESFKFKVDGKRSTIFYSVTKNNWYMILSMDDSELYKTTIKQIILNIFITLLMLVLIIILYVITARNRIKIEEADLDREVFVNNLIEELKDPVNNILRTSEVVSIEEGIERDEVSDLKASGIRINEILKNLQSYSSMVSDRNGSENRNNSEDISKSIRIIRRIIIFLLIIIMLISSAFFLLVTSLTTELSMSQNVIYYRDEFYQWENEQITVLSMFTDAISAQPELMDDYDKAVKWLDNIAKNYPSISVCYLANPYNEHTVIMNNGWQPEEGWKVEEREWYKSTEKSEDGFSVSAPYYDEQTGNYCITMSKVVYGKKGEFIGIFAIDLYMDKIISIFGNSYTNGEYVFLVDSNGDIINHPYKGYEMTENDKVNITDTPYIKAYNAVDGEMISAKDYNGRRIITRRMTDKATGFSIMLVWDFWNTYLYQLVFAVVYSIFILAIVIAIVILINKVIRAQSDMNKKLVEAASEAEAAGKAKSDFLAQMSHEIRTPINAVIGMDEMILRESDDPGVREYAQDIKSASKTLLSLINGVLDFSKIESGKMEIVPVKYEITDMISDMENIVSDRAEKKNLNLILDIDENLPKTLYGDDVRIRQVITNLLTNAVKYTEKGSVTFTMKGEDITDSECNLYIEVKDTGIGIKEEDMDKLFRSFQRLDQKRNRTIEGTGLGMSIVSGILKLMGSELQVESEYEKGSKFYFTISQKIIDSNPIGRYERHHLNDESYNEGKYLKIKEASILVVDDNDMNLKVAKGLMKNLGVIPELAGGGHEAIEMIRKKHYDIILMDHMMPEMDGIETLKIIKSEYLLDENTVVIALTANAISGAKEMYLSEGFNDYLSKPMDPKALEVMLVKYLPEDSIVYVEAGDTTYDIKDEDDSDKSHEIAHGVIHNTKNSDTDNSIDDKIDDEAMDKLVSQGFNVTDAMGYCMHDWDFYKEMMESFIDSEPEKKEAIKKFYSERNWNDYKIQVHSLKSSARTIGADKLSEMALEQEMAAKELDAETIDAGYEAMMGEYSSVIDFLKNNIIIGTDENGDSDDDMEIMEFFPE